jgi:hypothetical protein
MKHTLTRRSRGTRQKTAAPLGLVEKPTGIDLVIEKITLHIYGVNFNNGDPPVVKLGDQEAHVSSFREQEIVAS